MTLTCRVTESTPAARLTWLRGITQPEVEIQPGGRYLIAQEGNVSRLTIRNCSQGIDGGCYVCKAQNPVGLRELFVCLTVKREWSCLGLLRQGVRRSQGPGSWGPLVSPRGAPFATRRPLCLLTLSMLLQQV